MAGILDSINTLLSPLGTNFALKGMLERCLAARTKAEESEVVGRCLGLAEERLRQPGITPGEAARCLAMACFAATLGYDASFAAVHAVKMVQSSSLAAKRVGYLSCSVLLTQEDPLSLLLVNTVARDLCAGPALAVALALAACADSVALAQAPQLTALVLDKLAHPVAAVRARAVAVLHRHLDVSSALAVAGLLGDEDPAVAAATLPVIATALRAFPSALDRDALAAALAAFQRQVLQGRMPAHMRRGQVSAPFAQALAVRLLGECGVASDEILQLIEDSLDQALGVGKATGGDRNVNVNVGVDAIGGASAGEGQASASPSASAAEGQRRVSPAQAMVALACVQALAALAQAGAAREKAVDCACLLLASHDVNIRCGALSALSHLKAAPPLLPSMSAPCLTERRLAVQLLAATAQADDAKAACLRLTQHGHEHCVNEPGALEELVRQAVGLIDRFPGDWCVPALVRLLALADPAQAPALRWRLQLALEPSDQGGDVASLDRVRGRVLRALSQHARLRTASTALLEAFVWTLARFPHLLDPDLAEGREQRASQSENREQRASQSETRELRTEQKTNQSEHRELRTEQRMDQSEQRTLRTDQSQGASMRELHQSHARDPSAAFEEVRTRGEESKESVAESVGLKNTFGRDANLKQALDDSSSRRLLESEVDEDAKGLVFRSESLQEKSKDATPDQSVGGSDGVFDWRLAALLGQRRLAGLGLRAVRGSAEPRLLVAVGDGAMRLVAAAGEVHPDMLRLITELCAHATSRGRLRDCALELHACANNAKRLHDAFAQTFATNADRLEQTKQTEWQRTAHGLARTSVDPTLSCADAFVVRALEGGASAYRPRQRRKGAEPRNRVAPVQDVPVGTVVTESVPVPATEEEPDAWGTATRTVWSPGGRIEPVPETESGLETGPETGPGIGLGIGLDEDEASTSGDDFERLAADIAAMHR